ncbi:ROK family protein [Actinopolymorpha pittospori]
MTEPDDTVVLALDIGGTKLAGGLVDAGGRIRFQVEHPTPRTSDDLGDPGLAGTLALAAHLRAAAAERGWQVRAVGAGFPEYVDASGRLTSREVLAWTEQPADLLGDPCAIESDVRCGALAEWRLGAGAGLPGLFYVSIGTGLSSTLIADGQLVRGVRGEAIALGELPHVDGNLEAYASGAGVAARGGTDALESAGNTLGTVLAGTIVPLLDPPLIVLGGGLGTAETPYWTALNEAYDQLTGRRPNPPPVVRAKLGSHAGLIGAALFALVS